MRARGAGSWDLDLRIVEFDNVAQLLTAHQRAIARVVLEGDMNAMCQFRACEPGRDAGGVSWGGFFLFFTSWANWEQQDWVRARPVWKGISA